MVGLWLNNVDRDFPWSTWNSLTKDFSSLFNEMDRMLVPFRAGSTQRHEMPCDIHESDANYLLQIDVPGIAKDDIQIECSGNHLSISVERKQEHTVKELTTHRFERSLGSMKRTFSLPEGIDANKIQANCENGLLFLAIPKAEAAKPKRIEIQSGKSSFLKNLIGQKNSEQKIKVNNN